MTDKEYKLAFFIMLRNQIMASHCPEDPGKWMTQKYSMAHINRVAKITMDKMVKMIDMERAEADFKEVE